MIKSRLIFAPTGAAAMVPGLEKYHGTDTFLTEALILEALEAAGCSVDEGQPFFLYLSHYAVHNPFETDKRFAAHYLQDTLKSREAVGYATLVEGMDKSLGDVLDFLERKGIADRTLIIFLGDNGGDAPLGPARSGFPVNYCLRATFAPSTASRTRSHQASNAGSGT